ncbi:MAG: hypothetical protein IJA85_04435 [Clostridia bacterium]|nr:hypothetical protein [Clostridia bacterium]MBQ4574426.1 hypothetical protein [Clostridia bacterium]
MSNKDITRKRLFGTSIGGYNKQDVNEYITRLNGQFTAIEEDLKKTVEAQKKEIDALTNTNAQLRENLELCGDLEGKLSQVRNELVDAKEKIGECDALIASYQSRLDAVTAELDETKAALSAAATAEKYTAEQSERAKDENVILARELAAAKERIAELEAALAASDANLASCNDEKAKLYDEISGKIGSMMITAQAEAERITAEAASRSNDILTDAKQKSEEKLRRAGELGSSMIREFESITQSYTRRIRDEFSPEQQRPNDPTLSSDIIESSGI